MEQRYPDLHRPGRMHQLVRRVSFSLPIQPGQAKAYPTITHRFKQRQGSAVRSGHQFYGWDKGILICIGRIERTSLYVG